jgi:SAM-dependent methyltransferase
MEGRASDPRQAAIRSALFDAASLPPNAVVLEAGCGTGAVCRELARWPGVDSVTGLYPSAGFLARARELAMGLPNLRFDEGDARAMLYPTRGGVPHLSVERASPGSSAGRGPPRAARRRAAGDTRGRLRHDDGGDRPGGPAAGLRAEAAMSALVNDRWLVRRLPAAVTASGFALERMDSHGYVQTEAPDYMLGLVTRGADFLATWGRIDAVLAEALKAEARRRVATHAFFGFIGFAALVAGKRG